MRATITATTLLLATTALPVLAMAPAHAAASCADADTTWVAPSGGASNAWDEPANWTDGVPTATSVACIETNDRATSPDVADATTAEAAEVVLSGLLTVGGTLTTGEFTTESAEDSEASLSGGGQVVSTGAASLGFLMVTGGTTLTLQGDSVLTGDVNTYAADPSAPGLLEIADTAILTYDREDDSGSDTTLRGPLRNLGTIHVVSGELRVLGTAGLTEDGLSTGAFVAEPDATLWIDETNFGDGASVTGGIIRAPMNVAEGVTLTVSDTLVWEIGDLDPDEREVTGDGTVVLTDGSRLSTRIAGNVELVVPPGETAEAGGAWLSGQAHLSVAAGAELTQHAYLWVRDNAVVDVHGTHRVFEAERTQFDGDPVGVEVVHAGGQLVKESAEDAELNQQLVNHGTVRADSGTLEVTDLDPASFADGVLTGGQYMAAAGATLDLPRVNVNRADLVLDGPGSNFGDGLDWLQQNDTDGRIELRNGADLANFWWLTNSGHLLASPGSVLETGGGYLQEATGELVTQVGPSGAGRVESSSEPELAGDLVIQRADDYEPLVGDQFTVVTTNGLWDGRGFDRVRGGVFGNRELAVDYDDGRVLLRVVRRGAGCDTPDTTWIGPATDGASNAWDEPTNWSNGVPDASSVVCIADTPDNKAPHVAGGSTATAWKIDAADSGIVVDGILDLGGSMDARFLDLDGGTLTGGATTVTGPMTATDGSIERFATVVSNGVATLGELAIDGSLTLNGASSLTTDAHVDTDLETGLLKIGPTGTLLLDEAGSFVDVVGPLLNVGVVRAVAGTLFVVGWGHEFSPGFSTGTFEAEPDADLWVLRTDLGNGARVTGANVSGPSTIAEDATVTLDATALMRWGSDSEDPEDEGLTGGGELVALNRSTVGGWVGGSLELVIPDGEILEAADLTVADNATITLEGELRQTGDLDLQDDASMHVFGVHRLVEAAGTSSENTGTEVVEPGGLVTAESDTEIGNTLVNHGTVQAVSGRVDVTNLDAASLHGGVLDGGRYVAAAGATLRLPPIQVNQANLVLAGPRASFGDGLDTLHRVATDGRLELRGGVDLTTGGALSNVGHVLLSSGSRLRVDGVYRQGAAGELVTQVARNGNGRLVATGRRNLAGDLVVRRIAGYRPAVGDRFVVLTSNGRRGGGFDQVQGTTFGKRKFVVEYVEYVGADRVRLRAVKRG